MRRVLKQTFFERSAFVVARGLLGKFLVRRIGGKETVYMIVETEAYDGPRDRASHASKGRTKRNEPMWGRAGYFYVYLCYGMHWMLNIVTGTEGYPAAVLIRGISNLSTSDVNRLEKFDGPGRVTKALRVGKEINALRASRKAGLWFEDRGFKVSHASVQKTPRIGVSYAGPVWSKKKYRFVLKP